MTRVRPYAGVASIFRSALAAGLPPLVFADGGQTRDLVDVRDVVRANVLALTAHVRSGSYNIASGTPHTVLELAAVLADSSGVVGAPGPRVTGRRRARDVRHIVASPRRAADVLGFNAEVSFEKGMAELAAAPSGRSSAPLAVGARPDASRRMVRDDAGGARRSQANQT